MFHHFFSFFSLVLLFTTGFGFGVSALSSDPDNKVDYHWVKNGPYTLFHTPSNFEPLSVIKKTHISAGVRVELYAVSFRPGEPVYIELFPEKEVKSGSLKVRRDDRVIWLTQFKWGYRGFFGIAPWESSKELHLVVEWKVGHDMKTTEINVPLAKKNFKVSKTPLELTKTSNVTEKIPPETIEFIQECREKKKRALSVSGKNRITNRLSHPRDFHHITSEFWATRIYARFYYKKGKKVYTKPKTSIHRGLDFRGYLGEPIQAIADGRVVLSDHLYYEGNIIILDHGNRIYSFYMHMDSRRFKWGQLVRAGDRVGSSGATGTVTAAHLHLAVMIDGIPVNPLSFISLPVRN